MSLIVPAVDESGRQSDRSLGVGTALRAIAVSVPNRRALKVAIEVIWAGPGDEEDNTADHFLGARFIRLSEEDRRALLEMISEIRELSGR